MSQLTLLDIGPLTTVVEYKGQKITVYGISVDGIFYLMSKFVTVKEIMNQHKAKHLIADDFVSLGVDAIGTICAAATIDREEFPLYTEWKKEVEKDAKVASRLPPSMQLAIIDASLKLTFADGATPFAEQLMDMLRELGVLKLAQKFQPGGLESSIPSPSPTSAVVAKVDSATILPGRSSAALDTGTTKFARGVVPQDN